MTLPLISSKNNVFCLQPYAWLESYGCHGSIGIRISGSLIFSPVLLVLQYSFSKSFGYGLVSIVKSSVLITEGHQTGLFRAKKKKEKIVHLKNHDEEGVQESE